MNSGYSFVGKDGVSSETRSMLTPRFRRKVNMFDFDGVTREGANPGEYDIVVTGRTFEEAHIVYAELIKRDILVPVYFNPIHLKDRGAQSIAARKCSGNHKANIISMLKANDVNIGYFHEDDPIQLNCIQAAHPDVMIVKYPYNSENELDERTK